MDIEYDLIEHVSHYYDEYPIIYFNGKKLEYKDFLREIKNVGENE